MRCLGEGGRLDRRRRRPADVLATITLSHHSVSGFCRPACSARRRTERPRRTRSPYPTEWLAKGGTPNLTDAFHRTYANCQCLFHHGARSGRSEAGDKKF